MIYLLKLLAISTIVFIFLSIHIDNEPLFNHINKVTSPHALELIDYTHEKIKVIGKKAVKFVGQFFANSNPKNDEILSEAFKSINANINLNIKNNEISKKAMSSLSNLKNITDLDDAVDFFNQKESESNTIKGLSNDSDNKNNNIDNIDVAQKKKRSNTSRI